LGEPRIEIGGSILVCLCSPARDGQLGGLNRFTAHVEAGAYVPFFLMRVFGQWPAAAP